MNKYYIATDNQPQGPFTVQELKQRGITKNTDVWCDGMPDWAPASTVAELAPLWDGCPTVPVSPAIPTPPACSVAPAAPAAPAVDSNTVTVTVMVNGDQVNVEGGEATVNSAGYNVENIAEPAAGGVQPPVFDRAYYENRHLGIRSAAVKKRSLEGCPRRYKWLAILSFLGLIPCGVVGLLMGESVRNNWLAGNEKLARRRSRQALFFSVLGIVIGWPINFVSFFHPEIVEEIMQNILRIL